MRWFGGGFIRSGKNKTDALHVTTSFRTESPTTPNNHASSPGTDGLLSICMRGLRGSERICT